MRRIQASFHVPYHKGVPLRALSYFIQRAQCVSASSSGTAVIVTSFKAVRLSSIVKADTCR